MKSQRIGTASLWIAMVSALCIGQTGAAEFEAGVMRLTAPMEERSKPLDVTLWYPALEGGPPVNLGENIFFEGTPALLDAPMAAGRFPLILLSHGAGGYRIHCPFLW